MANELMPKNQQVSYVNIDYVVAEMQNELQDYGPTQRSRLVGLVISGLREFRLYDQALLQVATFTINEAGIIPFPNDYISYVNIGFKTHAGNVRDFSLNNSMLLERGENCDGPDRVMNPDMSIGNIDTDFAGGGPFIAATFWDTNSITPTFYGVGGGLNTAYYKIDEARRVIQFNGIVPRNEVVLVYKSTGISPNTIIPYELISPLKASAHYARIAFDDRVSMNTKQLRKEELREATSKLRAFQQNFTISQYLDVLYRSKKQTQKPA